MRGSKGALQPLTSTNNNSTESALIFIWDHSVVKCDFHDFKPNDPK